MDAIALVVFDLAGTSVRDTGQVPAAFTTVLSRHGIEVTGDEVRAVRGASKREAIRRLVAAHFPGTEAETACGAPQAATRCFFLRHQS